MEKDSKIMIENVMKLKNKFGKYPDFAKEHAEDYRTLNVYVNKRAKELKLTKGQIAKLADTKNQLLNYWEKNGISKFESALKLALALQLDFQETNDFLKKYAGMRQLFSEEEYMVFQQEEKLCSGDMGLKAQAYLDRYVEGSRFQKSYQKRKSLRNDVWLFDMIFFEEKNYYHKIYEKFQRGQYPTKNELIELGLVLRMTRVEIDEMLIACGHYPLSAKKIYEGALILALSYIEHFEPEQLNIKTEHYKPLYYRMLLQVLLEKCISDMSEELMKPLGEKPVWYAPENKQLLARKQRYAAIMTDMEKHIFNTWKILKTDGVQSEQLDCSLKQHVDEMLENVGYARLNEAKEQNILAEIQYVDEMWYKHKVQEEVLKLSNAKFRKLYSKWFAQMKDEYIEKYAPYLKEKRKKIDGN